MLCDRCMAKKYLTALLFKLFLSFLRDFLKSKCISIAQIDFFCYNDLKKEIWNEEIMQHPQRQDKKKTSEKQVKNTEN